MGQVLKMKLDIYDISVLKQFNEKVISTRKPI